MKALLFTVVDFPGIARLPRALDQAGWQVALLAPPDSFVARTRYAARRYHYARLPVQRWLGLDVRIQQQIGGRVLQTLTKAVTEWQPELLIPGDEPAIRFLYHAAQLAARGDAVVPPALLDLIARSLGDPASYGTLTNKRATFEMAAALGLRVPHQARVRSYADAAGFAAAHGWPVVLKQPIGYSGRGVTICHTSAELEAAYRRANAPLGSHRRYENLYRRLIGDTLGLAWHPTGNEIDVQQYIAGRPAMYVLAAIEGRTVAGFAARAERINPEPSGPSTVVRFIDHDEMRQTAEAVVRRTGYTGFAGFDYVIDARDGHAYLLECNPRPTPIVHLGSYLGIDLCRALHEAMAGRTATAGCPERLGALVALFPQEWARDRCSPFLRTAYHDVPWDDPDLLRRYVDAFSSGHPRGQSVAPDRAGGRPRRVRVK